MRALPSVSSICERHTHLQNSRQNDRRRHQIRRALTCALCRDEVGVEDVEEIEPPLDGTGASQVNPLRKPQVPEIRGRQVERSEWGDIDHQLRDRGATRKLGARSGGIPASALVGGGGDDIERQRVAA